ncbi:MAG: hypothetical protein H6934_09740 [Burkholderiaceae bacterium]|nr:hypothetical protein [Burkholderiaceae bacterium]
MSRRVALALHLSELANHFRNIVAHLDRSEVTLLDCAPEGSQESLSIARFAAQWGVATERADAALAAGHCYDVVVSNQMQVLPFDDGVPRLTRLGRRQVRLLYALGKLRWNLSDWNSHYHRILCFGPYQRALFQWAFPGVVVDEVGYPRFDHFFDDEPTRDEAMRRFGLDPARRTVVWLPTYGSLSSIDAYLGPVASLTAGCNVIVKAHPGTPLQEPERWARLCGSSIKVVEQSDLDNVVLFRIADWVLADYGGSAFGALYTRKPVLLLNAPGDLFAADTGWGSADLALRRWLPNLDPSQAERVGELLFDDSLWASLSSTRSALRRELFTDCDGGSGQRAAASILEEAGRHGGTPRPSTPALDRSREPPDALLELRAGESDSSAPAHWAVGYRWRDAWRWADQGLRERDRQLAVGRARTRALEAERTLDGQRIAELESARTELQSRLEGSLSESARLQDALAHESASHAREVAAHAQARTESDALRNELAATRGELRRTRLECDQAQVDRARTADILGNAEAALARLTTALDSPRFLLGHLRRVLRNRFGPRRKENP